MADFIKSETGLDTELIESGGGVFEVTVNEKLIFSKKAEGYFPEDDEIVDQLKALM